MHKQVVLSLWLVLRRNESSHTGKNVFFFACFTPTITFGGVLAVQTGNEIGVMQMIIATAFCGIIYAFFYGQPLIFLGHTVDVSRSSGPTINGLSLRRRVTKNGVIQLHDCSGCVVIQKHP